MKASEFFRELWTVERRKFYEYKFLIGISNWLTSVSSDSVTFGDGSAPETFFVFSRAKKLHESYNYLSRPSFNYAFLKPQLSKYCYSDKKVTQTWTFFEVQNFWSKVIINNHVNIWLSNFALQHNDFEFTRKINSISNQIEFQYLWWTKNDIRSA